MLHGKLNGFCVKVGVLAADASNVEFLNLTDAFDLPQCSFNFIYDAVFVLWKLNLDKERFEAECDRFFSPTLDLAVCRKFSFDFCFEAVKVFDYVFWKDFVGYKDMSHCAFTLWPLEAAFGAFVESAEFAAFAVTLDLDFAAVWAQKFCGFAARRNGFAAARACNQ